VLGVSRVVKGRTGVSLCRRRLWTIDLHAGGEPARVVVGGMPHVEGRTMREKRHTLMTKMDHIRKMLLLEPRGYPCQNANIIFVSSMPGAQFGYVILEQNAVYPMMSGHNTICVAIALLRSGMIEMPTGGTGSVAFQLESPGGLVPIMASCSNGKVDAITLTNVPSFAWHRSVQVNVPSLGVITVDVIYSGMWYCVVDLSNEDNYAVVGKLRLQPENGKLICKFGEMIKIACREQYPVQHPEYDYPGCDIMVFCGRNEDIVTNGSHAKNAVVMSNGKLDWDRPESWTGMLDRSPCGTGTSAVVTKRILEGKLQMNEPFVHESIIGTQFIGKVVGKTTITAAGKSIPAFITEITGSAYITQYCQIVSEDADPCKHGYTVGDIWS
jgi:proline racemase